MNRLTGMLRGIRADLRHGKDIELYITVPVAVVVTVASLLGQASAKVVTAVTLALLTLLIVALLKLRRQSDRLHTAGRITDQAASGQHHGRLEVRAVDYLAPYALFAYDPDLPTGRMDVRIAGLQVDVDTRPTFTITAANAGRWYQHFKEQFEAAWRLAEEQS
jgi:hypothetical protein